MPRRGAILSALATIAFAIALALPYAPGPGESSTGGDPTPRLPPHAADERAQRRDAAVARGLAFLASRQLPCGGFTGDVGHKQQDGYVLFDVAAAQRLANRGHVGVSALAGLAFLGAGHVPDRGRYAEELLAIVDYVLRCADEYGYLSDSGTRMYSHAFATLFLAQVKGMTRQRRDEVDLVLKRSAAFIVATQNVHGAWRYSPFTTEADLSVTVCQVQALRAARDIGIHVSPDVIDRVTRYVENSRIEDGEERGAFYYKIVGTSAYTKTSYAICGAAVTALHSAGVYDEERYGGAIRWIESEYPRLSGRYPHHFYFWYGNYYAAQAMLHVGGRRFERYFAQLEADLLARQRADGSWRNDVGPGDEFATAVACLLLRLDDSCLPIFQR
jgi:prenyltransferase beta subunit